MKKGLSSSLKILIGVGLLATTYTAAVLYFMAYMGMQEPVTLNACVFGGLGLANGCSVYLKGIKKKGENEVKKILSRKEQCNE